MQPASLDDIAEHDHPVDPTAHDEERANAHLLSGMIRAVFVTQPDQRLRHIFQLWAVEDRRGAARNTLRSTPMTTSVPGARVHPLLGFARLLVGAISCATALLAVLPAPTTLLWFVAIGVTEWGHLLAVAALAPLLPGWRRTRAGWLGGVFGALAALLLLSPLLRATLVARQLPGQIAAAFGTLPPRFASNAPARATPLVLADLVRGVAVPPLTFERVTYATHGGLALTLDVYRPPAAAPTPGVLVIHGGSWSSGESTQLAALNGYLAQRGYLVAALTYRLAPAAPFPAAYDDVRAALAYLRQHRAALGLDTTRLVLLGRSAGGQLALLAGYTDAAIRGVVALYAPADMRYGYAYPGNPAVLDGRAVLRAYLDGTPDTAPAAYDAASPIAFVGPHTPPTLLIHGGRDELVTPVQSERLAARLAQANRPHLLLRLPWATHGCDANFSGPSGQLSTYAIERFLAAVTAAR